MLLSVEDVKNSRRVDRQYRHVSDIHDPVHNMCASPKMAVYQLLPYVICTISITMTL